MEDAVRITAAQMRRAAECVIEQPGWVEIREAGVPDLGAISVRHPGMAQRPGLERFAEGVHVFVISREGDLLVHHHSAVGQIHPEKD